MTTKTNDPRSLVIRLLVLVAIGLVAANYFSPVWWVSLKAPNYPAEAFPDGVRIHFHMNGVFNGCQKLDIAEKFEAEALDCVHEMDAINHFVGMYPIASGGVIEKAFSQFLISMLIVMMAGFAVFDPRLRMAVLGVGFAGVAGWMAMTYYGDGGIRFQNAGYIDAMVTSLGQGHEEEGEEDSPIIAQLKDSLRKSGQGSLVAAADVERHLEQAGEDKLKAALSQLHAGSGAQGGATKTLKEILAEKKGEGPLTKAQNIDILKSAFENDQNKRPMIEREAWTGSGYQVLFWHYERALGRWFNIPEQIGPLVATMKVAGAILFWGVLAGMVFLVATSYSNRTMLYWLIVVIPILLPVFFILEYSSWLWWYGHSLNEMGAFTLKPFMPTVLGQGKVAQFSTHSYPHYGFGMIAGAAVALILAALLRRKQLREQRD